MTFFLLRKIQFWIGLIFILVADLLFNNVVAQGQTTKKISAQIIPADTFQTVVGFGAALAYYESWLTAHPNKNQIYEAIFGELSLDILRVRNAYDYDPGMVARVREFNTAAKNSLGKPISILTTSWGPPAYLKSNNDRKNGGTLKYEKNGNSVNFDYSGFAEWWGKSLDEYAADGIYPTYISIQNEPEFVASWESCVLKPRETITPSDTSAGYNKALDAVYEMISKRDIKPQILGPENVGIGYNSVENYINALDISKLDGIAHHLYHGVDENNPYLTTTMTKVGNFHPELPHFQTEYSRGDWFSLGGLIYKSFHDENVVSYLYWDLIWDGGGLVSLDFPWDKSRWQDPAKGYTKTKKFYAFKQFSTFIHPGWKRVDISMDQTDGKAIAFINAGKDSASFVVVNRSEINTLELNLSMQGYTMDESLVYKTSESENCELKGGLTDSILTVAPHSIATVQMKISKITTGLMDEKIATNNGTIECKNYPNPFSNSTTIEFTNKKNQQVLLKVFDYQGRIIFNKNFGTFQTGNQQLNFSRNSLAEGLYFYKLENTNGDFGVGRFIIKD